MDAPEQSSYSQLQEARLAADWSVKQVAEALNLPTMAIIAIEAGEFDKLHGDAFVIGYMRLYAELFQLDAEQIIADYRHSQCPQDAQSISIDVPDHSSSKFHLSSLSIPFQHRKHNTRYGVAAALCVAVGFGLLNNNPFDSSTEVVSTADGILGQTVASSGIAVETTAGTTVINSLDQLPDDEPTKAMVPGVVLQNHIDQADAESILQRRILGQPESTDQQADLSSLLSFQFSADCWVEIMDGDNQLIYSSLQKAQDRLELTGKPPFRITLGYAPGVELSYNGKPVNIDSNRENIAKLVLGNS